MAEFNRKQQVIQFSFSNPFRVKPLHKQNNKGSLKKKIS